MPRCVPDDVWQLLFPSFWMGTGYNSFTTRSLQSLAPKIKMAKFGSGIWLLVFPNVVKCKINPVKKKKWLGLSAALLASLVINISFLLSVADSWIICAYALLPDDSCAVGVQAVFQIRWIMNKTLQQKSCVLHKRSFLVSKAVELLCVTHWAGHRWAGTLSF